MNSLAMRLSRQTMDNVLKKIKNEQMANARSDAQASGKFDERGKSLTNAELRSYKGATFDSADAAVDKRYSYSTQETAGQARGLFGNRKRNNIFGN